MQFAWPESIRCAVSITFDDARRSQAEYGAGLLSRYGVRGTFYVLPDAVENELSAWRRVVADGHEIGHHTRYHPCEKQLSASKVFLDDYTCAQMEAELADADERVAELLGVRPEAFAYPCGHTTVGQGERETSYVPLIAKRFQTGRGYPAEQPNDPSICNMEYLLSASLDSADVDTVRGLIQQAERRGSWLILTGHETPADDPTLEEIVSLLSAAPGIWVDTVTVIAEYVLGHR